MSKTKTFTFDVELYTTLSVQAESAEDAERQIEKALHGSDANFGSWKNGDPIVSEVGIYDDGITLSSEEDVEDA